MGKKLTTAEFIANSRKVHGSKYCYSQVDYLNNISKVNIICKSHGGFLQTPSAHMQGKGCMSCSGKKRKHTADFISASIEVHGDKYRYSRSKYLNSKTKLTITCMKHGDFQQRPDIHASGHGCQFCAKEDRPVSNTSTTFEFIKKAKLVHGSEYDYSQCDYINSISKVSITCKVHGQFEQAPSNHLTGNGCPSCAQKGFSPTLSSFVYVLLSEDTCLMKVGITNNPKVRYASLKSRTPFSFTPIECFKIDGEKAKSVEREIHIKGTSARFTGFNGATEWIAYDSGLIDILRILSIRNSPN